MSSDFERRVTGIQGNKVSSSEPNDGDTLIWNASAQEWQPALPSLSSRSAHFIEDGYWTCPKGVTLINLTGCGGGGGGEDNGGIFNTGIGGNGGDGHNDGSFSLNGRNGQNAPIGSGHGGGAGGSAGTNGIISGTGGIGGDGGSGFIYITW